MKQRKTALVTGASRGIGRAICKKLAENGMDIAFTFGHDEAGAMETKRLCEAYGARVYLYRADVTSSKECASTVQDLAKKTGGALDVLVNNAGVTRDNIILRMTDEEMDKVLDTNLKGSFYMMREAAKIMIRNRAGSIINISSVVGIMGNAGQTNYAASKAGLIGMTKSLARELASRKIRVNAVAPGMIRTDMTASMTEEAKKAVCAMIPFREMGDPENIADAVAFLAGNESSYITGQVICVDGGMAI